MSTCACPLPLSTTQPRTNTKVHHAPRRGSVRSLAVDSRRSVLLSIGAATLTVLQPASATESVKSAHKQANGERATPKSLNGDNGIKTIKSAAGFEFKYPSSWLVAFERGDSSKEGTIAFVGNFINIDTFSVEKKLLDPAVAAKTDLVEMAEAIVDPIKSLPTTITFEDFGGAIKDSLNGPQSLCVLEYSVELCKGVVTEQLKGKKLCRDVKDNELQTIKRHHLFGIVGKSPRTI